MSDDSGDDEDRYAEEEEEPEENEEEEVSEHKPLTKSDAQWLQYLTLNNYEKLKESQQKYNKTLAFYTILKTNRQSVSDSVLRATLHVLQGHETKSDLYQKSIERIKEYYFENLKPRIQACHERSELYNRPEALEVLDCEPELLQILCEEHRSEMESLKQDLEDVRNWHLEQINV